MYFLFFIVHNWSTKQETKERYNIIVDRQNLKKI